jgi:hypothetical protein
MSITCLRRSTVLRPVQRRVDLAARRLPRGAPERTTGEAPTRAPTAQSSIGEPMLCFVHRDSAALRSGGLALAGCGSRDADSFGCRGVRAAILGPGGKDGNMSPINSGPPRTVHVSGRRPTRPELVRELRDVAVAVPLAATALLLRRWHSRWGATAEEVAMPMPGDDLVADCQVA